MHTEACTETTQKSNYYCLLYSIAIQIPIPSSFPPRITVRGKPWPRAGGAPAGIQTPSSTEIGEHQKKIDVLFVFYVWIPDLGLE